MRRRDLIGILGGAAVVWTGGARAQRPSKLPVIGFLGASSRSATIQRDEAFVARLRELGWIKDRTVTIEYRWADGRTEQFADIAAEFVRLRVDVIVTSGAGAVLAAMHATPTIPIVFAIASDPVGTGLVASLARPGGNVTGLSYQGPDLAAKRIEIMRELVPTVRRLAVMAYTGAAGAMLELREIQTVAVTLGLEIVPLALASAEDIARLVATLKGRADALYVCADPLVNNSRNTIINSALLVRLPSMFGERENVEQGGLVSYGPYVPDLFRRAADHVDKILRGIKPGEIPVEQPTKFELVINLKTAKSLGITVPATLLTRADDVIE
jgi:putative ABC transport system substrate-binding protein